MNTKQQRTKTLARILAVIVALAMVLMSGYYLLLAFSAGDAAFFVYAAEDPQTVEKNLSKLDALRDVVKYIDENYADDVNVEDLTDAAYNGVFDALDRWSVYYKTQEEKDAFINQVTGNYAGIGVTMTLDGEGRCVITQVNTLGPAYEAGVKSGMIIVSVDGAAVKGKTLDEISSLVRGEPGTKAALELELDGATQTMEIERRSIKAQTVTYAMLEDKIGYIAISQFSGDSWREFRTAKLNLIAEGMEALILDLRGNGGGVMGDALSVAGMLVPQGKPLVYYEQQGEIFDEAYSAGGTYKDVPLAVLIDGHTASASECLAAAVKDNGAGLTAAQIEAIEAKLLPMSEGRKYYKGQIGLTVLAAQQRLKIVGYDVDENARMDEKTVAALKRIQALYGASPYGGLDFCTIELVERALSEYVYGGTEDKQLLKAIEVLK